MSDCLPEANLAELSEFVETRMGLYFPRDRWEDLEQKMKSASREFGFADQKSFFRWLLSSTMTTAQTEILASHLTVSETYFWREPQVFEALEEIILPGLIRSRENKEKRLRIWSAGCATGEEPYSLAIAIRKAIPALAEWNITLLATDINPRSLWKASKGVYGEYSFRNSPQWLKEKYFHPREKGKFEIVPEIRTMVTLAYLNLAEDTYPSFVNNTNAMDIIFCRNVLMYFSPDWVRLVGERLFQSLVSEGWLMVSATELSLPLFSKFIPVHFPEAIVYRKTDQKKTGKKVPLIAPKAPLSPDRRKEIVHEKKIYPFLPPPPVPAVSAHSKDHGKDMVGEIRTLANQGNLMEALSTCEKALLTEKLDPQLYFLQATILQEQNLLMEAIASLKRALYINPNFIVGHFALGNLMLHQGKKKTARKHFENALVLLANFPQNEIPPESEGLTAGRWRDIISATMQAGALT